MRAKDADSLAMCSEYLSSKCCPCNCAAAVSDNLSSHKGFSIRTLIEARGARLLYLPAYKPEP